MPQTYGIEIRGNVTVDMLKVLTPEALEFVASLVRNFRKRRADLLSYRADRQSRINKGRMPNFLTGTHWIRNSDWKIAELPNDLRDRRVEITGPAHPTKMVLNGLNSSATCYMADFEDSLSPTFENLVLGQANLREAVAGTLTYATPEKAYTLNPVRAVLMVRPRGWHLHEKHLLVDGESVPASLFDFGLFFFHNAHELVARGKRPYFYLPKIESHLEARLWAKVFAWSESRLGLPHGTIRATVLIETILAAFEMDEILYELREYSAGLNAGRWDYLFSWIKKFQTHVNHTLPDRALLGMNQPFMQSYAELLVRTCHRRGAPAMGGMSAYIPVKNDPEVNANAFARVGLDKLTEVQRGFDGTWVAHPGLVKVAKDIFDENMSGPNQIHNLRKDVRVIAEDLLRTPVGEITLDGVRTNVSVGIQYLASWLCGNGCVPINNLMEDAATAEISRSQLWQWVRHKAKTSTGETITAELVERILNEELEKLRASLGQTKFDSLKYNLAGVILYKLATDEKFADFLTLPAYEHLE